MWIRRCDSLIEKQNVSSYKASNMALLLNDLKKERNRPFNKTSLIKIFNKYGLYLVIEDALKGTKVRGCTKVVGDNPAIYMTCYLKEKSSFYFVLYHELGHVKSDYNKSKSKVIIDGSDLLEKRADLFAVNKMIYKKTYDLILKKLDDKEKYARKITFHYVFYTLD